MRAYGVADLAWIGALRLLDCFDDDMRWRQRAGLFGQRTTERLHALVVHFLSAVFGQQATHFGDVLFVAAPLISALLEHGRAAGRATRTRCAHAWTRRAHARAWRPWPAHRRTAWTWATWSWSVAAQAWGTRYRQLWLELARASSTTAPRSIWATPPSIARTRFTFAAAMLAARRAAPTVAIEPVCFLIFKIAIDTFTPGACGPPTRRGLDDDERRLVLLGHLGGRQPSLLQRRELPQQLVF